ncbi:hypothetical protein AMTRI_Chr06g173890 [Amborella trichopoda]
MFIRSQRKLGYFTRKMKEPLTNDPSHNESERENLTVMTWLLHSMQLSISRGLLFPKTTKDIWQVLAKTY